MRFVRWLLKALIKTGAIALICMLLLEGALRLYPAALPLSVLSEFEPTVRGEIARRLSLPSQSEQVEIKRDDSGPRLAIFSPNQTIRSQYRDPGIVNEVVMDARGFCNPRSVDVARSEFDIVAIGDSFTWCTNVRPEDTWASRLGIALGASIYNLGRPRTGLYEYIQLLKTFGLEKRPRRVIMNIYEGNDLRDAIIYADHAEKRPQPRARGLALQSLSGVGRVVEFFRTSWLGRNSYAFNLVFVGAISGYEALRTGLLPRDPTKVRAGAPDFRYTLKFPGGAVPFNVENADPDEVVHARLVVANEIRLEIFDKALDSIAALSRERNFELLVTYSPSAYTAYAEFVTFADPAIGPILAKNSQMLRDYFAAAAKKRGIAFLDLTPALQAAARKFMGSDLLYYQTNVHFSASGHRVVAEAIAERLGQKR